MCITLRIENSLGKLLESPRRPGSIVVSSCVPKSILRSYFFDPFLGEWECVDMVGFKGKRKGDSRTTVGQIVLTVLLRTIR